MTGVPSAAAARYCSITYGRIFSRICMTLTIAAYDSSPNIQISLEADWPHLPAGPGGQGGPERAPCSRNSGQNAPHWNQRTTSSLKSAEVVSPLPKPPMSVVQYGMPVLHNKRSAPGVGAGRQQCEGPRRSPLMTMLRPARNCWLKSSHVDLVSPDHTAPAQPDKNTRATSRLSRQRKATNVRRKLTKDNRLADAR